MAVIRPEISTDPAELEEIAFEYLREGFPGWEPADGDVMTWLIGAHARMVAEERDIAGDVPLEQILRPLGEEVHRVLARVATPASVAAVVTLRDDAGYTIPAGTEMFVRTAGDDGVTMEVTETVTVPPPVPPAAGTRTASVTLRAIAGREGTAGNGLTSDNEVVPIRPLEFIESVSIAATAVSTGGTDAESDEQYLERLVETLTLTSPIPILAEDFAAIARQQPGVARALAINNHLLRDEVVRIEASSPTALTSFRNRARTYEIDAPASNAYIEALLESYYTGATVEGGPLGTAPLTIRLPAYSPLSPWTLSVAAGSSGSLTVLQPGGEEEIRARSVTVAVVGPEGGVVSSEEKRAVTAALEAVRELNWEVGVTDPTPNRIRVRFAGVCWPSYDPAEVRQAAVAALRAYLSPMRWGMGESGEAADSGAWVDERVVRYLEVAQVLNEVPGLRYLTELRLAGATGFLLEQNVALTGLAPLPSLALADLDANVVEA